MAELLKALRTAAMTRYALAEEVGASVELTSGWLLALVDHGIVERRPGPKRKRSPGRSPALFALSKEWGGQA
jgi:predicted Rossmann fold nucleotide-binding protein DprA/Smf involved in DNA uptake